MRFEAGVTHYVLHSFEDQAELSSEISDLAELTTLLRRQEQFLLYVFESHYTSDLD